jgi:5-methylcytosine-specific restriction endonuclease McrA
MKSHHAQAHGESIAGVTIVCDYCGEQAEKRQKKARNDHEFCSRDCYNNWQSEELSGENSHAWEGRRLTVECDWCGDSTEKHAVNYEKNERAFCTPSCHGEWISEHNTGENNPRFNPDLTVSCEWCGKEHQKSQNKIERNEKHFCSMNCRGEWQSENRRGRNHPRWIEDNNRISYGGYWEKQRKKRLKRDSHECVVCGKSNEQHKMDHGKGLDVHHITKARKFLREDGSIDEGKAHRLENLITLCISCHSRWEGIPLRPEVE